MAAAGPTSSLRELGRLFLKLGVIGFGGPAAHIAMMRDEVVRRRGWVSDQEFLDMVGACNLVPGPNSTELAIHLGHRRAGWRGLLLAGVNELVLLAAGALAAMGWAHRDRFTGRMGSYLIGAAALAYHDQLGRLFLVFLKTGAVLYGSGYVLLSFLEGELVDDLGWLTRTQLLDSIAVGQITPGPVFTTATFVGYQIDGLAGAAVATAGIFLPSFVFVAALGRIIPWLRRSPPLGPPSTG